MVNMRTTHEENASECQWWDGTHWHTWWATTGEGHRESAEEITRWMKEKMSRGELDLTIL